jgi:hypothetical protein
MMRIFVFIFWVTFSFQLKAQSYFNKVYNYYGSTIYNNAATSSYEYDNGDFLISGQKYYSAGFGALCFIRINSFGDTLYYKRFPKANCRYFGGTSGSLITTVDSNMAQCGVFVDSLGNYEALLVKLTENGDTLWTKTYGGANFDNANIVCQTPDSGFVMMGVTQSFSTGPASDFYMIKTDKNGNQLWQQVFGTTAVEDCISGQITLDGGFIMSGRKSNMFHLVKTDANGAFQWQQTYSGTKNVCFVKQLQDSTYLLAGVKDVVGLNDQACLMKVSKTGAMVWQKTYGDTDNQQFYAIPVVLADGSIVISGVTTVGGFPLGLLIKTDSLGNQQWLRTYYANPANANYIYDLKATSDNGFIMVGSGNITGQDAWVVKVDEFGCEVANCSVGVNEFPISDDKLVLYPNPAGNEINLEILELNVSDSKVEVVNILGEIQKFQISDSKINISHFAGGLYFITITGRDGKRWTEKFVKE